MRSPFSVVFDKRSANNIDKIISSNKIIDVARELGISVGKHVVPCVKKENHINSNGAPTMSFNLIKNTFRCWVCPDVGGDIVDLVMTVQNVDRERAVQFLSIRKDLKSDQERNKFFKGRKPGNLDTTDREMLFKDFFDGMDNGRSIDLIAFASTKGGTGKTLVVNNLAVIIALITRYLGQHRNSPSQLVELVDLDFGKPDQQLLFGMEPEYYIEDIFYQQSKELSWNRLRQDSHLDNLKLVSSSPIRKSNSLYYLKKNEILYMLHNSDAHIKLADFGGGSDKETLDFLSSIKSKVFVINPDRASIEAVFNLILSLLYYPMKQQFKGSGKVLDLIEKLRNCRRNGFTVNDLIGEIDTIDQARFEHKNLKCFYEETIKPFNRELGLSVNGNDSFSLEKIKMDMPIVHDKVHHILFQKNGKGSYSYSKKSAIYRTYNEIKNTIRAFESYTFRLENLLQTKLFGLVINKCDKGTAESVAGDLVERIEKTFSMSLSHLGDIPEEQVLRNISNYGMPFAVFDLEHEVLDHFFKISDTIIGLKKGSTEKIVYEQRDYVRDLKKHWVSQTEQIGSLA
jgi:MinD-like ATPase involved in chromosome partitioning or flagellar assembly